MEQSKIQKLKVILIGCSGVGKTCLITRFNNDQFDSNNLPTIGAGITSLIISIDGVDYNLQIWDTAGQDSLREITTHYFRDSLAAMIVFDISQRQTFNEVPSWIELLQSKTRDVPFMIVGNKVDKTPSSDDNFVSLDELAKMADEYKCPYFFSSALNGYGVNESFQELSTLAISPKKSLEPVPPIVIEEDNQNQNKNQNNQKCCF